MWEINESCAYQLPYHNLTEENKGNIRFYMRMFISMYFLELCISVYTHRRWYGKWYLKTKKNVHFPMKRCIRQQILESYICVCVGSRWIGIVGATKPATMCCTTISQMALQTRSLLIRGIPNPSNTVTSGALFWFFPFSFFFPFAPLHLTRCKKARLFYFHMNKSRILPTQTHFGRDSVCCMFGKCHRSACLLFLYSCMFGKCHRSASFISVWFESIHTETEEKHFFGISQSYTNQNLAQNVALLQEFGIYSNGNRTYALLLHLFRWRGWEGGKKRVNCIVPQIWVCSKDWKSRARFQILRVEPCLGYYSVFSTLFFPPAPPWFWMMQKTSTRTPPQKISARCFFEKSPHFWCGKGPV